MDRAAGYNASQDTLRRNTQGGSRRHYQVTSLGREVAQAETARIQLLLSIAREEGLTDDSAAPDRAS